MYQLTGSRPGFSITADPGVSPVVVNRANLILRNMTATVDKSTTGPDTDGDCVSDAQEIFDGSDPSDNGSFKTRLESPIYTLWNGFIDLINILELVNRSDSSVTLTVTAHDIAGTPVSTQQVVLGPRGQQDLIVNDIEGFTRDSYGIITVSFDENLSDVVDGRMAFYRYAPGNTSFEFAFAVPFVAPLCGDSFVSFNTFQPSLNALESQHSVAQWLSIVNLDNANSQEFTVRQFDQSGNVLKQQVVSVAPFGRVDLEGGHDSPGPSSVGLHQVQPKSAANAVFGTTVSLWWERSSRCCTERISFCIFLFLQEPEMEGLKCCLSRAAPVLRTGLSLSTSLMSSTPSHSSLSMLLGLLFIRPT